MKQHPQVKKKTWRCVCGCLQEQEEQSEEKLYLQKSARGASFIHLYLQLCAQKPQDNEACVSCGVRTRCLRGVFVCLRAGWRAEETAARQTDQNINAERQTGERTLCLCARRGGSAAGCRIHGSPVHVCVCQPGVWAVLCPCLGGVVRLSKLCGVREMLASILSRSTCF